MLKSRFSGRNANAKSQGKSFQDPRPSREFRKNRLGSHVVLYRRLRIQPSRINSTNICTKSPCIGVFRNSRRFDEGALTRDFSTKPRAKREGERKKRTQRISKPDQRAFPRGLDVIGISRSISELPHALQRVRAGESTSRNSAPKLGEADEEAEVRRVSSEAGSRLAAEIGWWARIHANAPEPEEANRISPGERGLPFFQKDSSEWIPEVGELDPPANTSGMRVSSLPISLESRKSLFVLAIKFVIEHRFLLRRFLTLYFVILVLRVWTMWARLRSGHSIPTSTHQGSTATGSPWLISRVSYEFPSTY